MPNTLTHYFPYVIYIMLRLVSQVLGEARCGTGSAPAPLREGQAPPLRRDPVHPGRPGSVDRQRQDLRGRGPSKLRVNKTRPNGRGKPLPYDDERCNEAGNGKPLPYIV